MKIHKRISDAMRREVMFTHLCDAAPNVDDNAFYPALSSILLRMSTHICFPLMHRSV